MLDKKPIDLAADPLSLQHLLDIAASSDKGFAAQCSADDVY
jgi:hypothetical protein